MNEKTHTVSVRLPLDLYEKIKAEAKRDERKVSQQIIYYLRQRTSKPVTYEQVEK